MANLNFIKKSLPWIGTIVETALPGPIGVLAKSLTDKLGKSVSPDPGKIAEAVESAMGDQAQFSALKQAELTVQAHMVEMGYEHETDLAQIAAQDRASARTSQVQTRSWTLPILAWLAVFTLLGCIYLIGFRQLQPSGHDAIELLIGAVIATYKDVYGYFFGSSAGSERKTELLAQNSSQ